MGTSQYEYYEAKAKRNRRRHVGWLFRKAFPFIVIGGLAFTQHFFPELLDKTASSLRGEDRSAEVYFPNCAAARAAGAAPIRIGQPGYREGLDGDDDGIACEPYRGRAFRQR